MICKRLQREARREGIQYECMHVLLPKALAGSTARGPGMRFRYNSAPIARIDPGYEAGRPSFDAIPELLTLYLSRMTSPKKLHLWCSGASEKRTDFSLSEKVADSDSLQALFLFLRSSVSPERLPVGLI